MSQRLERLQALARAQGVRAIHFSLAPGACVLPASLLDSHKADFLQAFLDSKTSPAPHVNESEKLSAPAI